MLIAVHNVTAATRLLDVADLVGEDLRVQTRFTVPPYSAFVAGTERFLTEQGITPLPWDAAATTKFDLVIAASHGGDIGRPATPMVIIPHGMGYNKYLRKPESQKARKPESQKARKPESQKARKPVFGMSAEWLLDDGELIPSSLVLSHPEQLDRLAAACPEAAEIAVLAGDPCLDRMLVSRPLRAAYRRALGVGDGRRLVVLSSTWGPESLYGKHPDLPRRLAAELRLDDYRVVMALHPAAWQWHTPWQINAWTAACRRAGVRLLPAAEGWRAALVAADVVVGDHGSVPFYGAVLGVPTVLAAAPLDAVDPDSAIGRFLRLAPKLDHTRPFTEQLDTAVTAADHTRLTQVTSLATSAPEQAMSLLRTEFYRLLDLDEPATPADILPVPVPPEAEREPGAQLLRVDLDGPRHATITRHSAERLRIDRALPAGTHLSVDTGETPHRLLNLAEIVVVPDGRDAAEVLATLPGCLLATGPLATGSWVVTGAGVTVRFTAHDDIGRVCASLVHALLTDGRAPEELRGGFAVSLGGRIHHVVAELGADPGSVHSEPIGFGEHQ